MIKALCYFLIRLYQRTLSPDHSFLGKKIFPRGCCRFYPTCSEYTKGAIEKYGVVRGIFKGMYRIARCNPLCKGGVEMP